MGCCLSVGPTSAVLALSSPASVSSLAVLLLAPAALPKAAWGLSDSEFLAGAAKIVSGRGGREQIQGKCPLRCLAGSSVLLAGGVMLVLLCRRGLRWARGTPLWTLLFRGSHPGPLPAVTLPMGAERICPSKAHDPLSTPCFSYLGTGNFVPRRPKTGFLCLRKLLPPHIL